MEYMVAGYTDVGMQKTTNQDSFCVRRASATDDGEILMAVVCDGMGGLEKGELASAECVNAFGAWFDCNLCRMDALCKQDLSLVKQQWQEVLLHLHKNLLAYSAEHQVQMGTTVTAILTYGSHYLIANIGDSRIYERDVSLRQLTQDQSLVAWEIANGRITEDEARHHPQRNVLLQCLGMGETATPVFTEGLVKGGALYLLCTDGLLHELIPNELSEALIAMHLNSKETLTEALFDLTERCKKRGETDNITAVLVKAGESSCSSRPQSGLRSLFQRMRQDIGATDDHGAFLLETAQIVHTQETIFHH